MAAKTSSENTKAQLTKLQAEVRRLKAENSELKKTASAHNDSVTPRKSFGARAAKRISAILLLSFAVALLVVGNLLFWTGSTIVDNKRFTQSVAPIIENTEVQHALADRVTTRLFENVDVQAVVTDVLPPRADFLAPSIASGVEGQTKNALNKVLANPKFQTTWNDTLERAHARFISSVEKNGSDGSIDITEVYQGLSSNLQGTKLSFLANKPLPAKVGNIEIVSGNWLTVLNRVITHIDMWRIMTITLLLLCAVAGIWLSKNRRHAVILFGALSAVAMFITLVSLRIAREIIAGKANPEYAQATREVAQIVFHPLVVQTTTILVGFALVALIAWVSGNSRGARGFRARTSDLLSGKLHAAIFSGGENGFTLWLGRYKRALEWSLVTVMGLVFLLVRLTPKALLAYALVLVVLILIVETLAAPAKTTANLKV